MNNCIHIPKFISRESGSQTERPIIVLSYPNDDGYWPEEKILFYQSSGMSNDRQEKTGGTWVPFYGIIQEGNRSFFQEKEIKKVDPDSGKETEYENGYFIKMSVIHQIKNKSTYPKKYYTKEINEFIKQFIDSLEEVDDFKEFDDSFIVRLNDYFTEVKQIVLSVWLDDQVNLWKNRPLFVAFLKKQPFFNELPDRSSCTFQEPSKKHDDKSFLLFLETNGFSPSYPTQNIENILSKDNHFIEQQDSIQYKQKAVMKLRTIASKKRLFSKVEEPSNVLIEKKKPKKESSKKVKSRKSGKKGGRKNFRKRNTKKR